MCYMPAPRHYVFKMDNNFETYFTLFPLKHPAHLLIQMFVPSFNPILQGKKTFESDGMMPYKTLEDCFDTKTKISPSTVFVFLA